MPLHRDSCQYVKSDGSRCRAPRVRGSLFCVFHDPDHADEGADARRRGGRNRAQQLRLAVLPENTPDLPLRTIRDIVVAIEATFNMVRRGQLDARIGNCLGVLAQVQLKAIEGSDLEQRIAALEGRQNARIAR